MRPKLTALNSRGFTLVEVMVTGLLFGVVLTMVARAMVVGKRAQEGLSHRVDVHRKASSALDLIVRDAEMASNSSHLSFIASGSPVIPFPPAYTQVDSPKELRIDRMEGGATIYDVPGEVTIGYYRVAADLTLRRVLYNNLGTIMPGTPPGGKIIARDTRGFEVKLEVDPSTGVSVLTARIAVATMNEPVTTEISLEAP